MTAVFPVHGVAQPTSREGSSALQTLIAEGRLRSVYQPIVCLDRLVPVGVEALVRGPAGSVWESPAALFGAAATEGLVGALDWASRRTALQGVLDAGVVAPAALFLNAEPEGIAGQGSPGIDALSEAVARAGVQVVLEITERALTRQPAELMRAVAQVRGRGWRIALDDVGAERASLALLPFLAPDVIKLDLRLIQARTTVEVAEVVNAVLAHSERTGAVVLAEGIETDRHLDLARSMGARLGQGWLFGRPGELAAGASFAPLLSEVVAPAAVPRSPWDLVRNLPAVRTANKPLLVAMSKTLERQAGSGGDACVVLGAFQDRRFFTPSTGQRYGELSQSAAFVAALGAGMPLIPATGVRGGSLAADDPLLAEWDVAVVGPHLAAALIAWERPDQSVPDHERLFDYILTYDRDRVLGVARSLMARVTPA